MSEPTYVDLWLVYTILLGRKVNLGFMIIQHMTRVLTSSKSILPYGMLLTTIFRYFGIDLDIENDIRLSKPSDTIGNNYITRASYKYNGRQWIEKACAPAIINMDTDEEAEIDIPSPLPAATHSPLPPPTDGTSSCSEHPE